MDEKRSGFLRGFRIRFAIAIVILGAYIYCDRAEIVYYGESTDTIYHKIMETIDIPSLTMVQSD